jgi:hypothetical protein
MTLTIRSVLLIIAISAVAAISSCVKKYDPDKLASGSWNPNIAVPIAFSRFDVYDILDRADENDLVIIDPQTGLLALRYTGQAFSFNASEVLDLPNASFNVSYTGAADLGFPISPAFNETAEGETESTFEYTTPNGEELHQITLASGTLTLLIETDLLHDVELELTFPNITQFGVPLSVIVPVLFSQAGTSTVNVNLSNHIIDFTAGGSGTNLVAVEARALVTGSGNPIVGNESIDASISLTNLAFQLATGYFGQQNVAVDGDSILIAIFQNVENGYFELTDPKLRLDVVNGYGFPVSLDVTELKTINANTGVEFPMTGFPNPTLIAHPTVPGDSALTQLLFDANNTSNISNVITPTPKYLHFAVEALSNPAGQAEALNFITAESQLRVDATLELPLEGFAYGFVVRDTIEFTFDDNIDEEADNIEWVKLRLNAVNGFPVDLEAQVYLLDSQLNVLDTLLTHDQQILLSGQVNQAGRVSQPTQKITDIVIPRDRVDVLYNTAHIVVLAEANTLNGQLGAVVGLYDTDFIEMRIGMQVQGRITY